LPIGVYPAQSWRHIDPRNRALARERRFEYGRLGVEDGDREVASLVDLHTFDGELIVRAAMRRESNLVGDAA